MALLSADVLTELHLGIAACGGNAFAKLSRLPGMAEIRRRTYDSRLFGSLEIFTLARGLPSMSGIRGLFSGIPTITKRLRYTRR